MSLLDKARLYLGLLLAVLSRTPGRLNRAAAYLDAWNAHDLGAIDRLTGQGHYIDPLLEAAVSGDDLRAHAAMLLRAFPDLRFELAGAVAASANGVVAHYVLHATNTGPLPGDIGFEDIEPTGATIALSGAITFDFSGTRMSVRNAFDQAELADALGFQSFLLPQTMGREEGQYEFGAYYRFQRESTEPKPPPGAIGMTWLHVHGGDAPFQKAATVTRKTLLSLSEQPGFIGGMIGARRPDAAGESYGLTVSAWESAEALEAGIRPNAAHKAVVKQFMKDGLAYATHSRVYELVRDKPVMMACDACGKQNNAHKPTRVCSACQAELGEPPAYW